MIQFAKSSYGWLFFIPMTRRQNDPGLESDTKAKWDT